MKILITGASGYIGSYLYDNPSVLSNHEIFGIDIRQPKVETKNRKGFFLQEDFINLSETFLSQFDWVIHLAAQTDASTSAERQEEIARTNIYDTRDFFFRIYESNQKIKILFPSSTSVYGRADVEVKEDDEVYLNPQSIYAKSKIQIEEVVEKKSFNNFWGDYIIARFGTIYGYSSGFRSHTAINKFCEQAVKNMPLTIWKQNYHQHRAYLYLKDAWQFIESVIEGKVKLNETYNVLSNNYKLSDITAGISKIKPDVKLNFVNTPLLNQFNYFVNFDKAKSQGFVPTEDNLFEEIEKTMEKLGQ